ncbi:MAG: glycine cleavage system aminomethyltransferase GcvT [Phycisphaeraceae bacterium]
MKRTPFYDFHNQHNARFVEFAGYEMPLLYSSIIEEHQHVRAAGGLFDVSHMGRVKFTGRHARRFLERILTRRVSDQKPNTCRYAMVCNERGGVMDDVIVYRFDDHWLLVVNAANREKLLAHFNAHLGDLSLKIEDQTEKTAMIAAQGPKVMDLIGKFSSEVPTLKRFHFCTKNLLVLKLVISRTGYTGEDGVEVILPANMASMAIKLLLKDQSETAVIKPAGLGARDTLRIEAAMPLYGHEIGEDIDPFSAGLDFAVNLDKGEHDNGEPFIGQDALKTIAQAGPPRKLVGLAFDGKRTPRQHAEITISDKPVGQVTSGCLSPTLGHPIAMALIERDAANPGDTVQVNLGRTILDATVAPLPFYKKTPSKAAAPATSEQ